MAKITIIFIGLIAHVYPIQNYQSALLIEHPSHRQLLFGDAGDIGDIECPENTACVTPFPPAGFNPNILSPDGRRILNISRAWLKPTGEVPPVTVPEGNPSFQHYVPSLRELSGGKPLRKTIAGGQHSVPEIAARFYTLTGQPVVDGALKEKADFTGAPVSKCVAECVKMEIEAGDIAGYVHLISTNTSTGAKRGVRIRAGATIYIANVSNVCPTQPVNHFHMFGRLVEPMVSLDVKPGGECNELQTRACRNPFVCSRTLDIECSATRYP